MKRCFLVLLLALLGTQTTPVSAVATSNLVVPSTAAMLDRCPKRCGNLTLVYPFGIGSGCFRDPDFNLTCVVDRADNISRLFFRDGVTQVVGDDGSEPSIIDAGWLDSISIAYADNIPVVPGVDVYNMSSWSPPGRSFFLFGARINVTGCGFDVYLLDLGTGTRSNVCSITCPGGQITEAASMQNCNGTWCCSVRFLFNFHGFQFSFVRRRGDEDSRVVDHTSPLWNKISVTTEYASLEWNVVDQPRCADAQGDKATYACRSSHSSCIDNEWTYGGYQCSCDGGYLGNPYVPSGCSRDKGYTPIQRATNCTRRCGNIDVPFPFGLEEGCFARKVFQLNCTNATTSTLQMRDDKRQVTQINLDEGLVDVKYVASESSSRVYIYDEPNLYIAYSETSSVQWAVANLTCQEAQMDTPRYACVSIHSTCLAVNSTFNGFYGYRCKCLPGFQGNPYVQNGCQDIDECNATRGRCQGICHNTVGSYYCSKCPDKTDYDSTTMQCSSTKRQNMFYGNFCRSITFV